MVSLLELASPGADVRLRSRLRVGELDGVWPDCPGREHERKVGYPLPVLENDLAALPRSCLCDGDDLAVLDLAISVVEELFEPEKRFVLQALLRGDGDTRHGGEMGVEGTRVDEDDFVLRRIELLGEPEDHAATRRAAADDDDGLLGALLCHFVRVLMLVLGNKEGEKPSPERRRRSRVASCVVGRHGQAFPSLLWRAYGSEHIRLLRPRMARAFPLLGKLLSAKDASLIAEGKLVKGAYVHRRL